MSRDREQSITAILVPQGAEYEAVCRGLKRLATKPEVLSIPIGCEPLTARLQKLQQDGLLTACDGVLLMGLCGSLTSHYRVGDIVVYRDCVRASNSSTPLLQTCDPMLTSWIRFQLPETTPFVRTLTSDRIIWSASEKRNLGKTYKSSVVDMEGFTALQVLGQMGIATGVVRVVSDDSQHDVPDLNAAVDADGTLRSLPLAMKLLQQPIAATRLISGVLKGLRVLQQVSTSIFHLLE